MNPLRIVHKNKKAIAKSKDDAFERWVDELIEQAEATDIKRAEKKYGVDLNHLKRNPGKNNY